LPATNQIDQIAAFNQTYKNAASNVTIQAIDPIVTDLQANKILWLALHDIPQRSIAFETRFDYKKRKPRTKLEEHIETISEFIGLALGAIARSGDPNPDTAVSNLIAFAGANFDPRGLTRAAEHALIEDDEDNILANAGERKALRKGHRDGETEKSLEALKQWRKEVGADVDPRVDGTGMGFPKKLKALAANGVGLEKLNKDIERILGYAEGDHVKEQAVMTERLEKIRRGVPIVEWFE